MRGLSLFTFRGPENQRCSRREEVLGVGSGQGTRAVTEAVSLLPPGNQARKAMVDILIERPHISASRSASSCMCVTSVLCPHQPPRQICAAASGS